MTSRLSLLPAAVIACLSSSVFGDVLTNVPEVAAEGYVLVYSLNIPTEGGFRDAVPIPYAVDDSATAPAFNRIAYYLEVDDGTGSRWVYASMDAFTTNAGAIGLPHNLSNPVMRQQSVSSLNVVSNVAGIVNASGISTGNIEFWPSDYGTTNVVTVPNANDNFYDFGDGGATTAAGYGSFQIHNHDIDGNGPGTAGQTLLAYNRWGVADANNDDLGIGTSPNGQPDYTFAGNAGSYVVKTLQVLVRPALPIPAPVTITSKVPEAEGFELVYELEIAARNDFTLSVPYTIDNAAAHAPGSFWRVAYFLELDGEWVWASMDAFTQDAAQLGVPAATAQFQQRRVRRLNVAASPGAGVAARQDSDTGNIEFWNKNYSKTLSGVVPGGSGVFYDSNDTPSASGTYGSMQLHDWGAGETIFAFNKWNTTTADSDLGIGNRPTADPDWTFAANAASYTNRKLYVLVEPAPFTLEMDAFPQALQFCPRDLVTGLGGFEVAGRESSGGFTEAVLRISREGTPFGTEKVVALDYSGGAAEFAFTVEIPAELAQFDAELVLRNAEGAEFSARRAAGIVAGDVFIVQGQSNANANVFNGTANGYQSPFVRTYGQNSSDAATTFAAGDWLVAQGDGSLGRLAGIGQWALVMANQLASENAVPIAILNGAHGGQPITFFQRDDANAENLATNYGRLLHRARKDGLTGAVRGFLFYQGESDGGNAAVHDAGFVALHSDWKEDYPNAERFYVFQLREGCGVARFNVGLRDVQRRFQDRFPDMTAFSVNGLDGHDGCHYAFAGGYESMGLRIAELVARDFYGAADDPEIEPPNPAYAVLEGANTDRVRIVLRRPEANLSFEPGAESDFALVGSTVTVVSGAIVDGAIELQLSGNAAGADAVVYGGHVGAGPWVSTSTGVALLTFSEPLVDVGLVPPGGVTATDGEFSDKIVISWNAAPDAVTGYEVFRHTADDFNEASSIGITNLSTRTIEDDDPVPGTPYFYWVKSRGAIGGAGPESLSDSGLRAQDTAGQTAAAARALASIGAGNTQEMGTLESFDRDYFSFTLDWPAEITLFTTGNLNTKGSLFASDGTTLIDDPSLDGDAGTGVNFMSHQFLAAGVYFIMVEGQDSTQSGQYVLNFDINGPLNLQPDGLVGARPASLNGEDLYNRSGAGQTHTLISRKLRPVTFHGRIENDGETPEDFAMRGTRGKKRFKVTYFDEGGNVTAAMVAGTHLKNYPDGIGEATRIRVNPSRKLKNKKTGRIKKKRFTATVTATSGLDGLKMDVTKAMVRTK